LNGGGRPCSVPALGSTEGSCLGFFLGPRPRA
jgi:hypothetical protein